MNLYRAFATVGGLTMVSRVLGFIRDILIAAALGTGAVADAFFVAFRFPNLFRRLFGEGAFNAAFVPLFAKRLEGDDQAAARRFAEVAMAGLGLVLVVLSAVLMAGMPWLMAVLAPGFVGDAAKYDLAVRLTQIAFPYLFCMSLVALISGVLNSLRHFWAAAAAPILLNVVLISAIVTAILAGYASRPEAGYVLAIGVFLAGFAQLAMVWIAARRAGMQLGVVRPRWNDDMRRLVALGIPGLVSGGITQINIVVGTVIASLEAGAVSYLYYADRLYQLPLGIVGVAIGVVLLPDLARSLKAGDETAVLDSQNRSFEFGLMLTLPAAAALAVAANPIISVLFERAAFTASDTANTAAALAAFAWGLPAFVLQKVFQPAYFAREDTRTPMNYAIVNMAVNTAGALALFYLFRSLGWRPYLGIAVATSIAAWINVALLWLTLLRRGHFATDGRLLRTLPKIVAATAVMAAVLWSLAPALAPWTAAGVAPWIRFAALGALVLAGLSAYGVMLQVTGAFDLAKLRRFTPARRSAGN
jgi:putative peptidoglycan lipid II flippase